MSKRRLTPQEQRLWYRFTHDVSRHHHPSPPAMEEAAFSPALPRFEQEMLSGVSASPPRPTIATAEEDIAPGQMHLLNKATARRLRRGQQQPEATLDLHGYTRSEAQHHFQHFLHHCCQQGLRVVRVITGYGKMKAGTGVLRAELPRWVNLPENRALVLSFDQARPQDGGAGAWIFYLKRRERL